MMTLYYNAFYLLKFICFNKKISAPMASNCVKFWSTLKFVFKAIKVKSLLLCVNRLRFLYYIATDYLATISPFANKQMAIPEM